MRPRLFYSLCLALLIAGLLGAEEPAEHPQSDAALAQAAEQQVRPFLAKHCLACHGPEKPKADLRLDQLSADLSGAKAQETWSAVVERLEAGEMPPKEKPRPAEQDVKQVLATIKPPLAAAIARDRARQGRTVLRRLNRVEYQNTIRDLLGIQLDLKDLLPPDSSANGFDNSGAALHTSSFLMEKYLDAADAALSAAIANSPQPPLVKKRLYCQNQRHVKVTTEKVFLPRDEGLVFFSSSAWHALTMDEFYPPDRGAFRFRISAQAVNSSGKHVTFEVKAGPMLMGTKNHLVSYFDAPADAARVFEFIDHFEARDHIRLHPHGLASAQVVDKVGADKYDGPGLAVEWVEYEGPLFDRWPPESHHRIFGDLPQAPAPVYNKPKRVEVVPSDPRTDAERILRDFAGRAYRRSVTDDDVKPLLALFEAKLAEQYSFEQAVRVGLKAILVSPSFLFLRESPSRLDDFAMASRLSYFLWSSMPDDPLLAVAREGKLSDPAILREQVERMLADSKAAAFTENFVGQWLGLRDIDFTEPSHILYPEYDEMLREAMVRETELFYTEVLRHDLSLANFVASDFSLLNERLARHYGIPGVEGSEFRKVSLPPESHRGGVLTMASVLKVTANGTSTSPVMRGAWVLDRILGTPPPKPPADVPVIEPDIRGATTIREQLAKHRSIESCAACHAEIDPPGFALESFDVIGGWRENYRTTGHGESVVVDGRRMSYHKGKPVDPTDVLPDGRKFANIDELKQLLLADKEQLARSLTEKLLTYATGQAPSTADKQTVERIVGRVREKDYGFRSLVHEMIQSNAFQTK